VRRIHPGKRHRENSKKTKNVRESIKIERADTAKKLPETREPVNIDGTGRAQAIVTGWNKRRAPNSTKRYYNDALKQGKNGPVTLNCM